MPRALALEEIPGIAAIAIPQEFTDAGHRSRATRRHIG
jgi:hypothetical protein